MGAAEHKSLSRGAWHLLHAWQKEVKSGGQGAARVSQHPRQEKAQNSTVKTIESELKNWFCSRVSLCRCKIKWRLANQLICKLRHSEARSLKLWDAKPVRWKAFNVFSPVGSSLSWATEAERQALPRYWCHHVTLKWHLTYFNVF